MTTVHCSVETCPYKDADKDTCKKTDLIITEAGCYVHIEADRLKKLEGGK